MSFFRSRRTAARRAARRRGSRPREAMPGKVLADRGHAGVGEALHDARAASAPTAVGSKCSARSPITLLRAVVEVEHRREAEVDAVRAELRADRRRPPRAPPARRPRSRSHSRPSSRIGGMAVKPSRKRCTRPPSWSTQIGSAGSRSLSISSVSSAQLLGVLVVAREQDHRAGRGMAQPLAVVVGERRPDHVDHRRAERQPYFSHSRITVANAMPRSSVSDRWERGDAALGQQLAQRLGELAAPACRRAGSPPTPRASWPARGCRCRAPW